MKKMQNVHFFGAKGKKGPFKKNLLGGKGANLAEMARMGFPVPPGFTIPTNVCLEYLKDGKYPKGLKQEVSQSIKKIEDEVSRFFGNKKAPLLISVRSGAPVSMPGMMDTILNLGLNQEIVEAMTKNIDNKRFPWDAYRRFIQMYGDVVLNIRDKNGRDPFNDHFDSYKRAKKVKEDTDLDANDLKKICSQYKKIAENYGKPIPDTPEDQLWGAISAVFKSWENERAVVYRRLNGISYEMGTAVNVQAMVFGNLNNDSGTGVAFTRNPATGSGNVYGEFLVNAQGEDVVAGIRTPSSIEKMEKVFPKAYSDLVDVCLSLEKHYREMQDLEFTVQDKKLWMLQCRTGKRTGFAAVQIAVDLVNEGIMTKEDALLSIDPEHLGHLLQPLFDPLEKQNAIRGGRFLGRGLPAGPGAATGRIVFSAKAAEDFARRGEPVVLVRPETSPEDIRGMAAARGILTSRGGMTSHAALVGRQMGKVCVVGCQTARIDLSKKILVFGGRVLREGNFISLDGTTGQIIDGEIPTRSSEILNVLLDGYLNPEDSIVYKNYSLIMDWADGFRKLKIRTNADQPDQARKAIAFGAEGIGLCRTEHMFFEGERIDIVREMILAKTKKSRDKALKKLLPLQQEDFEKIFRVMDGKPVTVRLLDPPLHEFLPHDDAGVKKMSKIMKISIAEIKRRIKTLSEANPMLGHRGCRLGLVYPEITEMQTAALFLAAKNVSSSKHSVFPEIMVPLVGHMEELKRQKSVIHKAAKDSGFKGGYQIGTMIELPRAALTADQIATHAEFFSFGTNDLTQTTFGLSRDDASSFLPSYIESGILHEDPFASLDLTGVGELVKMASKKGRSTKKDLKLGVCGEHGGDPKSITFFHQVGLNYVSCSPFRVPVARLAAAQAALKDARG